MEIKSNNSSHSNINNNSNSSTEGSETCSEYFARLTASRTAAGLHVDVDVYSWHRWVAPRIGNLPIATVTAQQVCAVRDALDHAVFSRAIDGPSAAITASTAHGIWRVVRMTFHHAACGDPSLRVRQDDPCVWVRAPRVRHKGQTPQVLTRGEFVQLVSCEAVPVEARIIYVIAVYTCMRRGELAALTWADVDLAQHKIRIRNDKNRSGVHGPYHRHYSRLVPIDAALLPLLAAMHANRTSDTVVVPTLQHDASELRDHLPLAGVAREELTTATFHALRHTGIVWLVETGIPIFVAKRRCGHSTVNTVTRYMSLASALVGGGQPLPSLPATLVNTFANKKGG